jgi:L-ascorbate metabolism protein UlaG (beta-lactamase superfamily)
VIKPLLQDEAFLADTRSPALDPEELRIWWLGQSGFLLRYAGTFALLDPYLSDSLTQKYAATDKPHVRMTERVVAPELLAGISVITSSHNHTDHLDAETLQPLLSSNPEAALIFPEANRSTVEERAGSGAARLVGLDDGQSCTVGAFEFHGIPAAHNTLESDGQGRHRFLGYVVRCGRWTVYHSGDTLLYPELVEKLRRFAPLDVALLPINGNKPERRVAGNLDGREAAELAKEIAARVAIPCHYEMFEFNTAPPDLFTTECRRLAQRAVVLRAGEGFTPNL